MEIINLKDAPGHLETLATWHQQEWSYLNPGQTLSDRIVKMQKYLNTDFVPSTYIAIDEHLLGSAAIVAHDMDDRPELSPWLASVFVTPEHRRKGIGAQLVKHVVAQASQHGLRDLFLYTPDQMKFYEKLGWHCLEQTPYHGHDMTIMAYKL